MPEIILNSLSELPSVARQIASSVQPGSVVAFYGEMGAGKTTLIKSICEELGVSTNVSSPTFSIVNEYVSAKGVKICHFDFYRLNSISEAYDMGYEEYFYSKAICFIEWPEKIAELLPPELKKVVIAKEGEQRTITF